MADDALFTHRVHHARLRSAICEVVRSVSMLDGRIAIDLHDDVASAELQRASAVPGLADAAAGEGGPVPRLSVAILVVGSRGDVQPFLPIARRLARDGHRVRIATHAVFRDFVESHGVEFFPLAADPRELMEYMVMTGGKLIPLRLDQLLEQVPRKRKVLAEILASTWAACTEPDPGHPDAAPFVADAVIANPPSQGHFHVAEALRAPLHIMFTMPWSPTRAFPHPFTHTASDVLPRLRNLVSFEVFDLLTWLGVADLVNEFREHTLGLERVHLGAYGASLVHQLAVPHAYLWSAGVLAKPDDWGTHIDVTGFVFLDDEARFEPPEPLQTFLAAGAPPVYVGFGSVPAADPSALTATIFAGLKRAGVRGLVARGWAKLGDASVPSHVCLIDEVPHDWLFPRCRAVCHHGGAGTTAAGLRHGRPTVIVPFFGDQYFWGDIVEAAGAGPAPVPIGELTAEKVAEAISFALRPEVAARAAAIGASMRAENGADKTVAAFYRRLPLDAMRCRIDPTHLARYHCDACGISVCRMCDDVIHLDAARALHRRHLLGHVAWDPDLSPSMVDKLEEAVCAPVDSEVLAGSAQRPRSIPRPTLLPGDSPLAQLHRRLPPEDMDAAERAVILSRFETLK